MKLTIGVKALNEEKHIAECLASAVEAVRPYQGEVILADSGSTDRTLEIARRYDVKIVTFADLGERCCGAGAQLAFQHAQGDFFYLLDGDMVLDPAFVPAALERFAAEPKLAGVGGVVREVNTEALEFQIRAKTVQAGKGWLAGEVDRLECGGLYRTEAIREVGYFADRNLHSFEEFDLGVRLQSHGWRLERIPVPAIDHFGHQIEGYNLLWRRMKSGYAGGAGEVLRAAVGEHHFRRVLTGFSHVRNGAAVIVWWGLLLAALLTAFWRPAVGLAALLVLLAAPLAMLIVRRGSPTLGFYSFVAWNVSAISLILGFLRQRRQPRQPILSVNPAAVVETSAAATVR